MCLKRRSGLRYYNKAERDGRIILLADWTLAG
jgi:hypothetical protein